MDPLSMLKQVVESVLWIKGKFENADRNSEDYRMIGNVLGTLTAIADQLGGEPGTLRDATELLKGATLHAYELTVKYGRQGPVRRAYKADDVAIDLGRLRSDLQLVLNMVVAANGVQLRADSVQLRADVAVIKSMLEIHLGKEVQELVLANASSQIQNTREAQQTTDAASSRIKNKSESNKTKDVASSQNENKRETEKAEVARPQVKIQESNGIGDSKALNASLSDKVISRSTKNMTGVRSIDVHPIKKWIVTGHEGGYLSIWDYQKQETVRELQVNKVPDKKPSFLQFISQSIKATAPRHWVCSTKFIVQEKWLAVGDGCGYIHIYTFVDTELHKVKMFEAYHNRSVDTLCVHPTEPYLLSSSAYGNKIKLWDWSRNWKQIQKFDVKSAYPDGVLSLKFNPRDTKTFACVTDDGRVMVGNINSSSSLATIKMKTEILDADYFFTDSQQHLMVTRSTSSSGSPSCEIRDLKTRKVLHTLSVSGRKIRCVSGHPTLPILVSASSDGTICYWDARTYRPVETVHILDSEPRDLVLVTDINGLTRLVAICETKIVIMEISLPTNYNCKHIDP